ncbi:hypothetical protein SELMODRAFT_125582 [Selaginella moellendorffii]|uniref:Pentacotripeptide-repeat region of PRORP domain-containing protein n=1 Tax=Selaginella moellendorffii TaxID=88036 RepID=D8SUT9_SELML|nr:hypothetical protein SELMODRAFT_125582 [Selaginella moellendorffii]
MNAYSRNGRSSDAIDFFRDLCFSGILPDELNFASALEACASVTDLANGLEIYYKFVSSGLPWDTKVGCALVDMLGKFGQCDLSRQVFDRVSHRTVDLWAVYMQALAHNSKNLLALQALYEMYLEGLKPDQSVFVTILSVCSQAGFVSRGLELFARNFDDLSSSEIFSSLHYHCVIDLLARAGRLEEAQRLFQAMPCKPGRDTISWTVVLHSYASVGHLERVQDIFSKLKMAAELADGICFVLVLATCARRGKLYDARSLFTSMVADYGVEHTEQHYSCMVDALGRAGHLREAQELLSSMPLVPRILEWSCVLGASKLHCDGDHGSWAATEVLCLDPGNQVTYTILASNSFPFG